MRHEMKRRQEGDRNSADKCHNVQDLNRVGRKGKRQLSSTFICWYQN